MWKILRPYAPLIALCVISVAAQGICELILPDINADIINNGVMLGDMGYIYANVGKMLAVALLIGVAAIMALYLSVRVSILFGRDLRLAIFSKVQSFSQADVDKFGTPSLITRTTNDVNQIMQVVQMGMRMMLMAPILCVGGIFMAIRQDVVLSGVLIAVVPVLAVTVFLILKNSHPMFERMQKQVDRLNQIMREKLSGMRVIRAFVRTEYEEQRYNQANREMRSISTRAHRIMGAMMPVVTLVMSFSTLAAYWIGARRIDSLAMPIGNLTAFVTYLAQILMSVMAVSMIFMMLPRASASLERIKAVMEHEPLINDNSENGGDGEAPEPFTGIEFKNAGFSYPDAEQNVLTGVSFVTKPGETTAIIGSTGSGKSTLINLIPRFYDVTEGQILINGRDIRQMSQKTLRNHLGYVAQKAFLFEGTVESNLRYGMPEATDEELWHALEVAQAAEFVREKGDRLESPITQGGTNVSGGQRQRLAIARAVVKKPDIFIFDDSFSALDFKTDAKLRAALAGETSDAAVLIVAQRISTVLNADRIVVLDQGSVAGIGAHRELLESCPVYREIVLSQLSADEVA